MENHTDQGLREVAAWRATVEIADYAGDVDPDAPDVEPLRVVSADNLLMHGGASLLIEALIGNGTATPGQALTFLGNATAAIGAGDGSTPVSATQTNLAGTNRLRKGMDSGFPQHTDSTGIAGRTVVWRATFSTSEANFVWAEAALFSSNTDGVGRMVNRVLTAAGEKTSAVSRVATITAEIN